MKITKMLIIAFALMLLVSKGYAQEIGKIGFANLDTLFNSYYKTVEYNKILEEKGKAYEAEVKSRLDKIKEAEAKLALYTDDKKAQFQEEVEKMKADLLEWDRQEKINLTKERSEKRDEILLEIEKIVSAFAEKENYSMIFNHYSYIYGKQTLNLTEKLLQLINANQPASK